MAEPALAGKVAIITGGVRRIGRAIALALAEEGAAVVINARTSFDEANAVVEEARRLGVRAKPVLADITDEAQVRAMVDSTIAEFGRVDILVNNASVRRECVFTEMTLAEWRSILAVVLDGAFLCSRAVIPHMLAAGGGAIVNIGGLTAHTGAAERAHVSTAKAGLVGLTKALAIEYAARGITVNCVAPGKIGGRRSSTSGHGGKIPGPELPPVGREGSFDEVAAIVRTLCLPTGRYVTGQTIHVNGGLYLP